MDFIKLFGQMDQVREDMEAVKAEIAKLEVTKETGAGLVKVTMDGNKKVLSLTIDPTLLHPEEQTMVQDLIIGAMNLASEEVDDKIHNMAQKRTYGF